MKRKSQDVLNEALKMPPVERAALVDRLLTSLDRPDDSIDKVWCTEIAARLRAYRSGAAPTISAQEVLAEYRAK